MQKSESLTTQDVTLFIPRVHRYYIQLQFQLFLFTLKRLILIEPDKVSLDFYIYQLFNIHTERLLDTVVPLNLTNVKTLVIHWDRVN